MAEEEKVVEGAEVVAEGQEPAPETLTIDGKEYSLEDVRRKLQLAGYAEEAEEKYNRPIGKFWPDYTSTKQKNAEYEAKLAELEKAKPETQPKPEGAKLSEEELKAEAIKQAEGLGLIHTGNFDQNVLRVLNAQRLIDEAQGIVESAKEDGKPAVELPELLRFMDDNGVKNPEVAYELMFREELKTLEQQKLKEVKPKGLVTQETSNAGSKQPEATPVTKEGLSEAIRSSLRKSQGVES